MATAESWQTAEIPGPTKALVITKPEIVATMIKRAKRPIMVIGHETAEIKLGERKPIDYMILIAKATKAPIVATAHMIKEFFERGFQSAVSMSALEVANRLQDSEWDGLDGKGQYDLALFSGIPYSMEWNILSGLKHFAPHLKTICLDMFYQPHASWSFPNISLKEWRNYLKVIVGELEAK